MYVQAFDLQNIRSKLITEKKYSGARLAKHKTHLVIMME